MNVKSAFTAIENILLNFRSVISRCMKNMDDSARQQRHKEKQFLTCFFLPARNSKRWPKFQLPYVTWIIWPGFCPRELAAPHSILRKNKFKHKQSKYSISVSYILLIVTIWYHIQLYSCRVEIVSLRYYIVDLNCPKICKPSTEDECLKCAPFLMKK